MIKYVKYLVVLIISGLLGLSLSHLNPADIKTKPIPTLLPTISPYPDTQYFQTLLSSKGLTIVNTESGNLTGNGKQMIFNTISTGCASCHYNEIHIFDNKKEIFVFYGENTTLIPVDGFGFEISQPVYKGNYSDRSETQSAVYFWNGNTFVKAKTSPNWVDFPQIPG